MWVNCIITGVIPCSLNNSITIYTQTINFRMECNSHMALVVVFPIEENLIKFLAFKL